MKELLKKLAEAKKDIASQKIQKAWKNAYSKYAYFTPEQVNQIVEDVCEKYWLFTKFDLIRDELWVEWQLTIYDVESDENITFIWATAIPEIKATNVAQQIWWCMTYTERYLKMTAFWIADNSLDLDTTENTKKNAEEKKEEVEKPRFNKEELEMLKKENDYVNKFNHPDALIKDIETKFKISKENRQKISDIRADLKK